MSNTKHKRKDTKKEPVHITDVLGDGIPDDYPYESDFEKEVKNLSLFRLIYLYMQDGFCYNFDTGKTHRLGLNIALDVLGGKLNSKLILRRMGAITLREKRTLDRILDPHCKTLYLLSRNFDLFGLIDRDLAVEAYYL